MAGPSKIALAILAPKKGPMGGESEDEEAMEMFDTAMADFGMAMEAKDASRAREVFTDMVDMALEMRKGE